MKQIILSLLLLLSLSAEAQHKKCEAINEKFFNAKVTELVQRLEMSDEQKEQFIPVYRRYCDEVRAVWGQHKKPQKPLTDEEKLERTKLRMERQQQIQAVRVKYIDEFGKVLSPKQVNQFYEVEDNIQKKLMKRRQHHRLSHHRRTE